MNEKPLILAADDEKDFLNIATVYLEAAGFRAEALESPRIEEIIRHCEEVRPDLALLDVYFAAEPVGLRIAETIKTNPRTSHIKVILWSSAPAPREMAADDFFNKGEDLSVLVEKIRYHLPAAARE